MSSKAFVPLESNPEVFTSLAHRLGLSPELEFTDVFSLTEPELLGFIPRPSYALILIFPITKSYEQFRLQEDEKLSGAVPGVRWFKQTIKNACGMFALIHCMANNGIFSESDSGKLIEGSRIKEMLKKAEDLSEESARTKLIEEFEDLNSSAAVEGQTETPDAEDEIVLHFIAYSKGQDGQWYELDGRRAGPVCLGGDSSNSDNQDCLEEPKVISRILKITEICKKDETGDNQVAFNVVSLGPSLG